jgi:hypothetical protein
MSDAPRHLCTAPLGHPERCRPEDCPGCAHERLVDELERVVGFDDPETYEEWVL